MWRSATPLKIKALTKRSGLCHRSETATLPVAVSLPVNGATLMDSFQFKFLGTDKVIG